MITADRLMVVIADRISQLAAKGEIIDRYYNPGNLFQEVHLVLINDDAPPTAEAQKMVGNAKLFVHNLPLPSFVRTLGWQLPLLKPWIRDGVQLAKEIKPSLIRCHGVFFNGLLCAEIKKRLGVPYALSLHTNPEEPVYGRAQSTKEKIVSRSIRQIEKVALCNSDKVLPVYQPIVPYIQNLGVTQFEVAYNVINPSFLKPKSSYELHSPVRIVSVGRQIEGRNPENIIRSIRNFPEIELTMIGTGPLHEYLRRLSVEYGVNNTVKFISSMANDELCASLCDYDIFSIHSEYWELNKSLIEALLTGLPCVINQRVGKPVPELQGDFSMQVENTPKSYSDAFRLLVENTPLRKELGLRARAKAEALWAPAKTELNFCRIYKDLLQNSIRAHATN